MKGNHEASCAPFGGSVGEGCMAEHEKPLLRPASVENRLYVGVSRRLSKIACEKAKWGASLESLIVFNCMANSDSYKSQPYTRWCTDCGLIPFWSAFAP